MKTSEIFQKLSELYKKWGDFEKCTCSADMYKASWIMDQISLIFYEYENGMPLMEYNLPEDAPEDEKLIENINTCLQHLI